MATATLPPSQRTSYSAIIDSILADADLETISAKRIRKGLQERIDHDLTDQKEAITTLIMERFDKKQREEASPPPALTTTNGTTTTSHPATVAESIEPHASPSASASASPPPNPSAKRKASSSVSDPLSSEAESTPPPAKKVKTVVKKEVKKEVKVKVKAESDEQMAKRLQAEYSAPASRSTRGGGTTKPSSTTKSKPFKTKKKAKSAARVGSDDDPSTLAPSTTTKRAANTGFNKPMTLSPALAALTGTTTLSRPQTVKRIWEYIKERDLQDPKDRRTILCDEVLRRVMGTERVSMFRMNKVLSGQMWEAEGVVEGGEAKVEAEGVVKGEEVGVKNEVKSEGEGEEDGVKSEGEDEANGVKEEEEVSEEED